MLLRSYLLHLRARNLSPKTIKATEEYLRPFLAIHDPLKCDQRDLRGYLADMSDRCRPSTVWTAWRHLRGFYTWLQAEGEISANPMLSVPKPMLPPVDVKVLTAIEIKQLLATCRGNGPIERRDLAVLTVMLDAGLRLSEVAGLTLDDVGVDSTLRVFGKGRKWRMVALGTTASSALDRWLRIRGEGTGRLWTGRQGDLTTSGIRRIVERRGKQAGIHVHPHMLRHTFVDNWLRNGGNEVDLARLAGWTGTVMASRYAQHLAAERALQAHQTIAPLDRTQQKRKNQRGAYL